MVRGKGIYLVIGARKKSGKRENPSGNRLKRVKPQKRYEIIQQNKEKYQVNIMKISEKFKNELRDKEYRRLLRLHILIMESRPN